MMTFPALKSGLLVLSVGLLFHPSAELVAQSIPSQTPPATWRPVFGTLNPNALDSAPPEAGPPNHLSGPPTSAPPARPVGAHLPDVDNPAVSRVTQQLEKLPNSAGQIWREYDITPYTAKISNNENPQQAIVDWILKETGKDMWFHQPLGILSATDSHLYVYHTPEIQSVVRRIVDRFVRTRGQLQKIDLNLMTVENPNWRAHSYTMLQPIEVRAAGVEAFMISKENAALLQGQLARRADTRTVSSGLLTNHDGQALTLKKTRPIQFVRSLQWIPNQTPNYQPLMTNIDEGYSLEISCLSSLDNNSIEAMIECHVDQVEKLSNVKVNLPGIGGNTLPVNLQIPQLVSWRLHERFRWPNDQVLLLSCGVVATPEPDGPRRTPLLALGNRPQRADALLFIEYRGPATGATLPRTADAGLAPIRPRQ